MASKVMAWQPVAAVPIESQHTTYFGEVVHEMVFAEENRLLVTNGPNQHDSNALAVATLSDNIRLCELVDAPPTVAMPDDIRAVCRRALQRDGSQQVKYRPDGWQEEVELMERALAWFRSQEKGENANE